MDVFAKFRLFCSSTFDHLHQGQRTIHAGPLSGARRIDFVCMPVAWKSAVTGSWVDTTFDLMAKADDHFLVQCDFRGTFVGRSREARQAKPRINARKWVGSTPESQCDFIAAVNRIPVPDWSVPVHFHKLQLTEQVWSAADLLEVLSKKAKRPFASDAMLDMSKRRSWSLREAAYRSRLIRRHIVFRFSSAWRARADVYFYGDHVVPPHEFTLRVEIAWHYTFLRRTVDMRMKNIRDAKKTHLQASCAEVNSATGSNIWRAVACFRKGAGGKIVQAYDSAISALLDKDGKVIDNPTGLQNRWVEHTAGGEGGRVADDGEIVDRVLFAEQT